MRGVGPSKHRAELPCSAKYPTRGSSAREFFRPPTLIGVLARLKAIQLRRRAPPLTGGALARASASLLRIASSAYAPLAATR